MHEKKKLFQYSKEDAQGKDYFTISPTKGILFFSNEEEVATYLEECYNEYLNKNGAAGTPLYVTWERKNRPQLIFQTETLFQVTNTPIGAVATMNTNTKNTEEMVVKFVASGTRAQMLSILDTLAEKCPNIRIYRAEGKKNPKL